MTFLHSKYDHVLDHDHVHMYMNAYTFKYIWRYISIDIWLEEPDILYVPLNYNMGERKDKITLTSKATFYTKLLPAIEEDTLKHRN